MLFLSNASVREARYEKVTQKLGIVIRHPVIGYAIWTAPILEEHGWNVNAHRHRRRDGSFHY